jgi:hypothetical protein
LSDLQEAQRLPGDDQGNQREGRAQHARGMLIPCKSCRAKIGADDGMIRLTEQSEQKG